ncbi:hypothetical protein [Candidatus Uabimicrobium amorphum]|uniref:Uncharacterized protein n=1 Tax=Uabimicrobium amorphum TaxID=2596890 RepID=A0A5S9IRH2_UABAM|nr:hypothetical protein [Candidatus Uabimicrobium amorphum]BBM86749.1 hypothetical protein UABAM_05136 [Candidatus Uabimicrobium amorphum]
MEEILRFLEIEDLELLREARKTLPALDDDSHFVVQNVVDKWDDEQAVANILMCPDIMEESYRWQTIEKGLESYSNPYYILSTVCGLQHLTAIPDSYREKYLTRVLRFCETKTETLAICASITVTHLLRKDEDYLFSQLYPVFNDNVNHNITLYFAKNYDAKEFKAVAKKAGLSWGTKRHFLKEFAKIKEQEFVKAQIPHFRNS